MITANELEINYTQRVDKLISMAGALICQSQFDVELYYQWKTASKRLLSSLPILPNQYKDEFDSSVQHEHKDCVSAGLGILKAFKDDVENHGLTNGIELIKAEVFTDFLDMAEHLLENNYKDPAAFLIGAVLEGELRNLCKRNSLEFREGDAISSLNTKLADNNIYSPTIRSQIQAWKKIRDSADHKKFDDYTENQVKDFLSGVRTFIGEYLG